VIPVDLGPAGPAKILVSVGERVLTGQSVAQNADNCSVHASISGLVTDIAVRPVPGPPGLTATCISIKGDGKDLWHDDCKAESDTDSLGEKEILRRIAAAGIVGLGGALFPTAEKLSQSGPVKALIINGAECEPYISCDERLMRERPQQVIEGTRIMLRALRCKHAVIALESDMPEARVALQEALAGSGEHDIDIAVVTAKYPAGGERQLIELLTGLEVPADGLPADIGYVCQNVATAEAVAALFNHGRPLISRVVTVTGLAVKQPMNVEARIGTPLSALLTAAGGLVETPDKFIMGGPMMGHEILSTDLPVTKSSNCLLAAAAEELGEPLAEYPCIRCGQCSDACPARLLPQMLLGACESKDTQRMQSLGLGACIECGCCDVVCPSQIALTQRFVSSKQTLRSMETDRIAAARAKSLAQSHDEREARIARREAEALTEQDQRLAAGQSESDEIEALLKRVAATDEKHERD
jgi:electron transport complex protein RnfC